VQRSNLHLLRRLRFLSTRRRFEWYPPFWLMRVRVVELAEDWCGARIRLPLNWVSANAAGNMFGGYQSCLADPVPAIACICNFPGYRVATKSLAMDFLRVGNSDLVLHFDFDAGHRERIRQELEQRGRADPCFDMAYYRDDGKVCTKIRNTVAIRSLMHDSQPTSHGHK
jgi:acyl-coenzyme A thioesterase PaaI-like protein